MAPTPPPDYFTLRSTPDPVATQDSPEDVESEVDQHDADGFENHGDGLEYLKDGFLEPQVPDEMLLEDNENLSKSCPAVRR